MSRVWAWSQTGWENTGAKVAKIGIMYSGRALMAGLLILHGWHLQNNRSGACLPYLSFTCKMAKVEAERNLIFLSYSWS